MRFTIGCSSSCFIDYGFFIRPFKRNVPSEPTEYPSILPASKVATAEYEDSSHSNIYKRKRRRHSKLHDKRVKQTQGIRTEQQNEIYEYPLESVQIGDTKKKSLAKTIKSDLEDTDSIKSQYISTPIQVQGTKLTNRKEGTINKVKKEDKLQATVNVVSEHQIGNVCPNGPCANPNTRSFFKCFCTRRHKMTANKKKKRIIEMMKRNQGESTNYKMLRKDLHYRKIPSLYSAYNSIVSSLEKFNQNKKNSKTMVQTKSVQTDLPIKEIEQYSNGRNITKLSCIYTKHSQNGCKCNKKSKRYICTCKRPQSGDFCSCDIEPHTTGYICKCEKTAKEPSNLSGSAIILSPESLTKMGFCIDESCKQFSIKNKSNTKKHNISKPEVNKQANDNILETNNEIRLKKTQTVSEFLQNKLSLITHMTKTKSQLEKPIQVEDTEIRQPKLKIRKKHKHKYNDSGSQKQIKQQKIGNTGYISTVEQSLASYNPKYVLQSRSQSRRHTQVADTKLQLKSGTTSHINLLPLSKSVPMKEPSEKKRKYTHSGSQTRIRELKLSKTGYISKLKRSSANHNSKIVPKSKSGSSQRTQVRTQHTQTRPKSSSIRSQTNWHLLSESVPKRESSRNKRKQKYTDSGNQTRTMQQSCLCFNDLFCICDKKVKNVCTCGRFRKAEHISKFQYKPIINSKSNNKVKSKEIQKATEFLQNQRSLITIMTKSKSESKKSRQKQPKSLSSQSNANIFQLGKAVPINKLSLKRRKLKYTDSSSQTWKQQHRCFCVKDLICVCDKKLKSEKKSKLKKTTASYNPTIPSQHKYEINRQSGYMPELIKVTSASPSRKYLEKYDEKKARNEELINIPVNHNFENRLPGVKDLTINKHWDTPIVTKSVEVKQRPFKKILGIKQHDKNMPIYASISGAADANLQRTSMKSKLKKLVSKYSDFGKDTNQNITENNLNTKKKNEKITENTDVPIQNMGTSQHTKNIEGLKSIEMYNTFEREQQLGDQALRLRKSQEYYPDLIKVQRKSKSRKIIDKLISSKTETESRLAKKSKSLSITPLCECSKELISHLLVKRKERKPKYEKTDKYAKVNASEKKKTQQSTVLAPLSSEYKPSNLVTLCECPNKNNDFFLNPEGDNYTGEAKLNENLNESPRSNTSIKLSNSSVSSTPLKVSIVCKCLSKVNKHFRKKPNLRNKISKQKDITYIPDNATISRNVITHCECFIKDKKYFHKKSKQKKSINTENLSNRKIVSPKEAKHKVGKHLLERLQTKKSIKSVIEKPEIFDKDITSVISKSVIVSNPARVAKSRSTIASCKCADKGSRGLTTKQKKTIEKAIKKDLQERREKDKRDNNNDVKTKRYSKKIQRTKSTYSNTVKNLSNSTVSYIPSKVPAVCECASKVSKDVLKKSKLQTWIAKRKATISGNLITHCECKDNASQEIQSEHSQKIKRHDVDNSRVLPKVDNYNDDLKGTSNQKKQKRKSIYSATVKMFSNHAMDYKPSMLVIQCECSAEGNAQFPKKPKIKSRISKVSKQHENAVIEAKLQKSSFRNVFNKLLGVLGNKAKNKRNNHQSKNEVTKDSIEKSRAKDDNTLNLLSDYRPLPLRVHCECPNKLKRNAKEKDLKTDMEAETKTRKPQGRSSYPIKRKIVRRSIFRNEKTRKENASQDLKLTLDEAEPTFERHSLANLQPVKYFQRRRKQNKVITKNVTPVTSGSISVIAHCKCMDKVSRKFPIKLNRRVEKLIANKSEVFKNTSNKSVIDHMPSFVYCDCINKDEQQKSSYRKHTNNKKNLKLDDDPKSNKHRNQLTSICNCIETKTSTAVMQSLPATELMAISGKKYCECGDKKTRIKSIFKHDLHKKPGDRDSKVNEKGDNYRNETKVSFRPSTPVTDCECINRESEYFQSTNKLHSEKRKGNDAKFNSNAKDKSTNRGKNLNNSIHGFSNNIFPLRADNAMKYLKSKSVEDKILKSTVSRNPTATTLFKPALRFRPISIAKCECINEFEQQLSNNNSIQYKKAKRRRKRFYYDINTISSKATLDSSKYIPHHDVVDKKTNKNRRRKQHKHNEIDTYFLKKIKASKPVLFMSTLCKCMNESNINANHSKTPNKLESYIDSAKVYSGPVKPINNCECSKISTGSASTVFKNRFNIGSSKFQEQEQKAALHFRPQSTKTLCKCANEGNDELPTKYRFKKRTSSFQALPAKTDHYAKPMKLLENNRTSVVGNLSKPATGPMPARKLTQCECPFQHLPTKEKYNTNREALKVSRKKVYYVMNASIIERLSKSIYSLLEKLSGYVRKRKNVEYTQEQNNYSIQPTSKYISKENKNDIKRLLKKNKNEGKMWKTTNKNVSLANYRATVIPRSKITFKPANIQCECNLFQNNQLQKKNRAKVSQAEVKKSVNTRDVIKLLKSNESKLGKTGKNITIKMPATQCECFSRASQYFSNDTSIIGKSGKYSRFKTNLNSAIVGINKNVQSSTFQNKNETKYPTVCICSTTKTAASKPLSKYRSTRAVTECVCKPKIDKCVCHNTLKVASEPISKIKPKQTTNSKPDMIECICQSKAPRPVSKFKSTRTVTTCACKKVDECICRNKQTVVSRPFSQFKFTRTASRSFPKFRSRRAGTDYVYIPKINECICKNKQITRSQPISKFRSTRTLTNCECKPIISKCNCKNTQVYASSPFYKFRSTRVATDCVCTPQVDECICKTQQIDAFKPVSKFRLTRLVTDRLSTPKLNECIWNKIQAIASKSATKTKFIGDLKKGNSKNRERKYKQDDANVRKDQITKELTDHSRMLIGNRKEKQSKSLLNSNVKKQTKCTCLNIKPNTSTYTNNAKLFFPNKYYSKDGAAIIPNSFSATKLSGMDSVLAQCKCKNETMQHRLKKKRHSQFHTKVYNENNYTKTNSSDNKKRPNANLNETVTALSAPVINCSCSPASGGYSYLLIDNSMKNGQLNKEKTSTPDAKMDYFVDNTNIKIFSTKRPINVVNTTCSTDRQKQKSNKRYKKISLRKFKEMSNANNKKYRDKNVRATRAAPNTRCLCPKVKFETSEKRTSFGFLNSIQKKINNIFKNQKQAYAKKRTSLASCSCHKVKLSRNRKKKKKRLKEQAKSNSFEKRVHIKMNKKFKAEQQKIKEEEIDVAKVNETYGTDCLSDFIIGVIALGIRAMSVLIRIVFKIIIQPKQSYEYTRHRLRHPVNSWKYIRQWCSVAWQRQYLRMARTMKGSRTMTVITDEIKELPLYQAVESLDKTHKERKLIEVERRMRRQRKNLRDRKAREGCDNILLLTLRKTPCFWVYHVCPRFYPQCLTMLKVWRDFTNLVLFCLAIFVWSPCIIAFELCRTLLCCVACVR